MGWQIDLILDTSSTYLPKKITLKVPVAFYKSNRVGLTELVAMTGGISNGIPISF